ncbi:MAG TPA: hypothetical protein VN495_00355 [Candidatus Paceibacterota bacterium]|nr:hypothetical protein [Candidatus Paceibacterota bacterium]
MLLAVIVSIAVVSLAHAQCQPGAGTVCPTTSFQNVQDFVSKALQVLVQVSLPVIGFFIVFVGFQFVSAQGNPGKLATARKNLLYVLIGAGLVLGAWVLATLIGSTVSELSSGL